MDETPLPEKFSFLSEVCRKYTFPHGKVAVYEDMLDRLTPANLAELAVAYERLAGEPGGIVELSTWIEAQIARQREIWDRWCDQEEAREQGRPLPGPALTEPSTADPPVFYLFFVFDLLRQRCIAPFSDGRVRYSPPPPVLDWTKLPEEFRWLAGPAERYGRYGFHGSRLQFSRRLTSEQRAELRDVVRRLWTSQQTLERFQQWCAAHPETKHPEAKLLGNLWDLIVEIGEADDDKKPRWMGEPDP